ncbi:MAG: hypothetical protein U5R14_13110 [Gemmatimonadota bacterium]|nr:hypothetical protein [Gemmatimonadota bacterium]
MNIPRFPVSRRLSALVRRSLLVLSAVLLSACGGSEPEALPSDGENGSTDASEQKVQRTYERSFAFMAELGDSLLLVPWIMRNEARADSVTREAGGWLARGGEWEPFYHERWSTPGDRAPERILPHRSLSLVVRDGGVVDGLLFQDGLRNLEILMGEVLAAWVGPNGETLDVMRGSAYLSDERVDGRVVDVSRSWSAEGPPAGDWAFLISGDSVELALAGDVEHGLDRDPVYRGWAQIGAEDLVWPEVDLAWTDREGFPPARRDVPTAWRIRSGDGSLTGTLESVSSETQAGEGPGPLLPVRALVEVSGEITTVEGRFPVRGLLIHERR